MKQEKKMNQFKLTRNEEIILMLDKKFRDEESIAMQFADCDGFCIVKKTKCIRIYAGDKRAGRIITEILFN